MGGEDPVTKAARDARRGPGTPERAQSQRTALTKKSTAPRPGPSAAAAGTSKRKVLGKKSSVAVVNVDSDDGGSSRKKKSKSKKHKRSRSSSSSSSSSSSDSSSEDERRRRKSKKSKKSKKSRRRSPSRDNSDVSSEDETETMSIKFSDPAKVSWDEDKGVLTLEDDGVTDVRMEIRHQLRTPNSDPVMWWKKPFCSEKTTPVRGGGLYLEAAMGVARINELTLKRLHFRSHAVNIKMLLTRNADVNLKEQKVRLKPQVRIMCL